jgi:N-carbamoylputrescine amidase
VTEAAEDEDAVILAQFDLAALAEQRDNWFVFRDRRPELYGALGSLDGRDPAVPGS